jgi:hypothetical protein
VSDYWGVVKLRVEGIGGRWPVGGESNQRVGLLARQPWWAAVGSASREAGGRGTFYGGHRAVVREFLLRSKATDRDMGKAWARGAATCGGRSSQWQLDVRAPASTDTPRGTGL